MACKKLPNSKDWWLHSPSELPEFPASFDKDSLTVVVVLDKCQLNVSTSSSRQPHFRISSYFLMLFFSVWGLNFVSVSHQLQAFPSNQTNSGSYTSTDYTSANIFDKKAPEIIVSLQIPDKKFVNIVLDYSGIYQYPINYTACTPITHDFSVLCTNIPYVGIYVHYCYCLAVGTILDA